jgi:hypothetical protein
MTSRASIWVLAFGMALALPASALAHTHVCQVLEVATFTNRVHVLCKDDYREGNVFYGIRYFAVPTSNSGEAARLTTLGSAALLGAGDGELTIDFDLHNGDATAYGCISLDCRRPLGVRLK